METLEHSTTSVNRGPEPVSSSDDDYLRKALRVSLDVHDHLRARQEVKTTLPFKQLSHEISEETDMYEPTYDVEPQVDRVRRGLGRGALSRLIKGADKWAAYGSGWLISKLPGTKSLEERAEYQKHLNEKYADSADDSWIRRRINSIQRNRLNIRDRVPVYAIGAMAMYRFAPMALDLGVEASHGISHTVHGVSDYFTKPRTVTMGQDLAADSIDYGITEKKAVFAMGGHTQGLAEESGYVQSLRDSGAIAPDEEVVPVDWSAEMGTVLGDSQPMTVSDAEGGAQIAHIIRQADGRPIKIISFSQGTEATLRGLNEIAANSPDGKLPDNVEVVLQGTPAGPYGMSHNKTVGAINPLLGAMGLEINQPVPEGNVKIITRVNDVFGNSADQSTTFMGAMAISPGHQVKQPGDVLLDTIQDGTTTVEVWGPPEGLNHPVTELLAANGFPVSPELNEVFENAVPRTPHGEATRYTDVSGTVDALGVLADTNLGGTNYASNAIHAAVTPQMEGQIQDLTDMQKIADQGAEMINNPATIPQNLPVVMNEIQDGIHSGLELLNPNEWMGAANRAIQSAGGPAIFPENPAPAPAPAPAPLPDFSQPLQQVNDLVGQFLQGFQPPR